MIFVLIIEVLSLLGGEIEHYKHFLPRILEIYNQLNGRGMIGLYEITNKLDYAKWITWEEREKKTIQDFVLFDWTEFVNEKESEISESDLEYYSFFFKINDLLQLWKITEMEKGLRNFVHFFYYYGSEILNKGLRIKGKIYEKEFKDLINQDELIEKLETEFFREDEKDQKYAEKISAVIQMIEHDNLFFP